MWIGIGNGNRIRHESAMEVDIELAGGASVGEGISGEVARIAEERRRGISRKRD